MLGKWAQGLAWGGDFVCHAAWTPPPLGIVMECGVYLRWIFEQHWVIYIYIYIYIRERRREREKEKERERMCAFVSEQVESF